MDLYSIDSEIEDWSKYGGNLYAATGTKPASPVANLVNEVKEKIPDHDKAGIVPFVNWLNTRVGDAVEGVLGAPAAVANMNQEAIRAAGKFFGVGERTSLYIAKAFNAINPVTAFGETKVAKDLAGVREKIDKAVGAERQNAPESWGTAGKVIDAATTAATMAPFSPGSALRNLAPAVGGAVGSELAGAALKDTPFETPARVFAGLLTGMATGHAQNYAGNVGQGVRNAVAPVSDEAAQARAARILGRAEQRDQTANALLEQRGGAVEPRPPHAEYLPGTPYAATAGENVQGVARGAYVPQGPARSMINQGAEQFRNTAEDRVEPVIGNLSRLPGADVREPQLRAQAGRDASPIYSGAAGVANDPQAILTQRAGAPVQVPSSIVGADGRPIMTTRPGPPVTDVTTNSPVLRSPDLANYMNASADIRQAIRQARRLPAFADEPVTSMAMLDKVYKYLGDLQSSAQGDRTGVRARDIGGVQRQFLAHIEAENPAYARALEAFTGPSVLADASRAGANAAAKGVNADQMAAMMHELPSDQARAEFRGGYAGALRERAAATARATDAERMYGAPRDRAKLELALQPRGEGPTQFRQMDAQLMNEARAQRAMRDITKGSTSVRSAHDAADVAAGDHASVVSDLMTKGATGAVLSRMVRGVSGGIERVAEGNTESVNAAMARMLMETDPRRSSGFAAAIERARQEYERTQANRMRAPRVGAAIGGLLGLQE